MFACATVKGISPFIGSINIVATSLEINVRRLISIQNFRVFNVRYAKGKSNLCGAQRTENRTFDSPNGAKIYKYSFTATTNDTLQILINGTEIFRSNDNLWHDCSADHTCNIALSKTSDTNLFRNGTNVVTFINRNRNSGDCKGDLMSMYVTFYVYYR